VVSEKLSRATVAEHAVKLADAEGVSAVTIRRLAQDLGVTPMALYWHFKNKDELMVGIADHVLSGVTASRTTDAPWPDQLRTMVEALVAVMRAHPSLPDLLHALDKQTLASFNRATNDALELLARGGLDVVESMWVASYLLNGAVGLVAGQPGCPAMMSMTEAAEWRRQKRLALETLPSDEYPMVVRFARTIENEPDVEGYYRFGIDMLMAGATAMAARRSTDGAVR
jgi:TetR/AcrR family tetracycline transcriptional repressor